MGVAILGIIAVAVVQGSRGGPSSDPVGPAAKDELSDLDHAAQDLVKELQSSALRLPLAAALGAVLALRPRRRGTPVRDAAVVQTQIVLAVVGAMIMLIVGGSLARAFAIVGVTSLIRYRTKIDNPKDAVVMLSALAVGLASGVGLTTLAVFATVFVAVILLVIEGFESQIRVFELSVKLGAGTAELRSRIEAVLRSFKATYELRALSAEEASYRVIAPHEMRTDLATRALTELAPNDEGAVLWNEKPKANSD
jgi:hypothetical protein